MKKTLLIPLTGAALLTTSLFLTTPAFAAEVSSAESRATINFTPGDGSTPPLNPNDPDNPNKPEDPEDPGNNGTGNEGEKLTLRYVSNVAFGEQKISAKTETYAAKNTQPIYMQVNDERGTKEGWTLTAQSSGFKNSNDATDEIQGAILRYTNGVLKTQSGNVSEAPTQEDLVFDNNEAKVAMTAAQGQGAGPWLRVHQPSDVEVTIPGNAAKADTTYTCTLKWTLTDAPQP